jgi:nucleotide-binding universal stress UspA family protein
MGTRPPIDAVIDRSPDVLCVGTHGAGLFEGLLGSLSTKLARLAPCSALLIR